MSQQLIPLDGGVEKVVLTPTTTTTNVLSTQYIIAKNLQSRPTEWVPDGRPIYRRLPAVSETYVIDFFNVVSPPNTAARAELEKIGYIYVPWTENSEGPTSVKVNVSENKRNLLIAGGKIVWEYGGTQVLPTIINLETLQLRGRIRYFLAYELIYDDTPVQKQYYVEDFALTGQPLDITSSTDNITGWRFPAVNAFLNTTSLFWSSKDTYFPSFAQPASSYIQWKSTLGSAYSKVVLRCPSDTAYTAKASFFYVTSSGVEMFQGEVSPSLDSTGQYYQFDFPAPAMNTGWKVVWSDTDVAIQSILVTGAVTLEERPASESTRAALVIWRAGTEPKNVTYCPLAYVDVNNNFEVEGIEDIRYVIRRDYVPVADWLTKPFDETLINLYEQVSEYPQFWMNPPTCMKQEYADLIKQNIVVV
jgi:hypothetical protein